MDTLLPLDLPPGLYRNGTPYQGKNRWIDGQLVRFYEGTIRPVGGWTLAVDSGGATIQASGFPRYSIPWRANDGSSWLAVGTNTKAYAFNASVLTDITPGGLVTGAADGTTVTGSLNYGAGNYGAFVYGGSSAQYFVDADTWSLDNYGEQLLGCLTSDGKIYKWDKNIVNDFVQLTNSPTSCRGVLVTPERFVVALASSGVPRQVAWADQTDPTIWTPSSSNSAGSYILPTNGRLMSGRRLDRETILLTDSDCWSMSYIGGPFYFSFAQRGENCGILGPNALAVAEGVIYWMGTGQFFAYAGAVRPIPCEVADYVFSDLNQAQRAKVVGVPIPEFGEVWWFYPSNSQSGLEDDRYVILNYRTGVWSTGILARAAGVGSGVFASPQMWGTDGKLYTHEFGFNHDSNVPFLTSGPIELGNGDRLMQVQRLIPDEAILGQVTATFFSKRTPLSAEQTIGPFTLTNETSVRLSGRQIRLKLMEAVAADWRVGTFRLGVLPGERR